MKATALKIGNLEQVPTYKIVIHLYKRYEAFLLYLALLCTWFWITVRLMG